MLQQALAEANTAYRNFFASIKGTRKGRKLGAPRLRSRKDRRQSIRFTRAARFRVTEVGRLRLPGIGDVPVRWSRELPSVGIDLGLTHCAVLSDGRKVDAPRFARKAQAKLRRAQKELARRQKGSNNREKSRRKVARAHVRVADTRRDWLHTLSTTVVRENQLIAVEDLAVSGLARTPLARSVHDAGWSTFVQMLTYKAQRAGRRLVKVDRWFPSTRLCSACGAIGEAKPLHVRTWTCGCGITHDRDWNAANNILAAGRGGQQTTPVEPVSAGTPVPQPAAEQEPTGSAAQAAQTGIPTVHSGEDVNRAGRPGSG